MLKHTLTIFLDDNNSLDVDDIFMSLRYSSFTMNYYKSFVPPNKVEFVFSNLTEIGVNNTLEKIRKITTNFKWTVSTK